MESILNTVKAFCGYEVDYTPFDDELIILINRSIRKLNRLGVGVYGFNVTGPDETWKQLFPNNFEHFTDAQSYISIDVKILHDNSSMSSYVLNAYKEELKELAWQMNLNAEVPTPH